MKSLSWKNIESTNSIVKIDNLLKFMTANGAFKNNGDYADAEDRHNFVSGFKQDHIISAEVIERKGRRAVLRQLNTAVGEVVRKASTYLVSADFSYVNSLNRLWPVENLRESDNKYTVMIMVNFERVPDVIYSIAESGISDLPPNFDETDMAVIDEFSNSIDELLSYVDNTLTEEIKNVVEDVVTSKLKF